MRREDKVKRARTEAWMRKHEADHARYFRFLDELKPADGTIGARVDALVKEFGIGQGEVHGAYLHYIVSAADGGTPEERAEFMGGM